MVPPNQVSQVIHEWNNAPYGHKAAVVRRFAAAFDVSYNMLYQAIKRAGLTNRKKRADIGRRENPAINEWTKMVWKMKLRPPEEAGAIATDQAIIIAAKNGLIPEEAANIPPGTYNRIARELKLNREQKRHARFQAKYANLVHQFDASSSKFFYVARTLPDDDCVLKMHRPAANYKNKPVPTRLRPWVYGVVDDYSGYFYCRYTAALGESAADGILFLKNAWCKRDGAAASIPFRGLPRMIYADQGPLLKAAPTRDFLERLGVTIVPGTPYNSKARGKIEKPWSALWSRFERTFFCVDDWKGFEIKMSELNRQLINFMAEASASPHRQLKDISREASWRLSINERGGVVDIPENALSTIFQRHERKVSGGYFQFNNQVYEVAGMNAGWVMVYEGVFDDRLIVEDMQTQTKYEVKLSVPLAFGQRLEMVKSEAEKLALESREHISITSTYYNEAEAANVVSMPVKGEERKLVDPLNIPAPPEQQEEAPASRLFQNEQGKYEWLLERKATGSEVQPADIKFMRRFEESDLYRQLEPTYQRWIAFWERQGTSSHISAANEG